MKVWTIADVHLSFGVEGKEMDVFGDNWKNHSEKLEKNWRAKIADDDLILMAGDISWALHIDEVKPDLDWIGNLPGTKVMIRGNHDLWWKSAAKVRSILPPSIHIIHHDAFFFQGIAIGGSRLWDHPDIAFDSYIEFRKIEGVNIHAKTHSKKEEDHDRKVFTSEINRLRWSLDAMEKEAKKRIVMVHHPPTGPGHEDTPITKMLEEARIDIVLYGHLHSLKKEAPVNFTKNGVRYLFTAADYLDFDPLELEVYSISNCKQL